MSYSLICTVLFLSLVATPAAAQGGGIGTGEDGCYFGACPGETKTDEIKVPPPETTSTGPLQCVTHFGTCQMMVPSYADSICHCTGNARGYNAVGIVKPQGDTSLASVPNIASICQTQIGACQMAVQLPRAQACYCPTPSGPVWGISE